MPRAELQVVIGGFEFATIGNCEHRFVFFFSDSFSGGWGCVGLEKVIKDNGQLALHMCAREAAWMAAASSFADWHRTWPSSEAVCRLLIKAYAQVKHSSGCTSRVKS